MIDDMHDFLCVSTRGSASMRALSSLAVLACLCITLVCLVSADSCSASVDGNTYDLSSLANVDYQFIDPVKKYEYTLVRLPCETCVCEWVVWVWY